MLDLYDAFHVNLAEFMYDLNKLYHPLMKFVLLLNKIHIKLFQDKILKNYKENIHRLVSRAKCVLRKSVN